MRALLGFLTIAAFALASCNTAYQASSTTYDDLYYSASNDAPQVNVAENNSHYQRANYTDNSNTYSNPNQDNSIYYDSAYVLNREAESKRIAAEEYNTGEEYYAADTVYVLPDTVIYIEEDAGNNTFYYDLGFSYRINRFHRPYWRFSYYDPFYYPYNDPYLYYTYWDYPFSMSYYDWTWSYYNPWYYGSHWPYHYGYHYWGHNYYYDGYYGNTAVNHFNSRSRERVYGPRRNMERSGFGSNLSRASSLSRNNSAFRSFNKTSRSTTKDGYTSNYNNKRPLPDRKSSNPNVSRTQNQSRTNKYGETNTRNVQHKRPTNVRYTTNPNSQRKATAKYSKPRTYTSPTSRRTTQSGQARTSNYNRTNYRTFNTNTNTKRAVKRVVTNPNRRVSTQNSSTPKSYSRPVKTKSQNYRSPSKDRSTRSYSTPSRTTKSYSTTTRSKSNSSSINRSSSGGSRSSSGGSRGSSGGSRSGGGSRKR